MDGEDGCDGRPRTDPRSTTTGPDLEGVGTTSAATRFPACTALGSDDALERIADGALRPGDVGPVGLELEAHLVDLDAPDRRVGWARIRSVLGDLPELPGGSRVTLEPGGQVELSGPPWPDVAGAVAALRADQQVLSGALAPHGLAVAALGTDPLRPPARVSPAPRYAAMEEHFAAVGCADAGLAMMTSTASLQVNLEAGPPAGWSRRISLAHQLGPVLVAVSACSPLRSGRPTGWRSSRQQVWGDLDQARCGPLLGGCDPANEWGTYAMSAPVMLVRAPGSGRAEPVRGRTSFAQWVSGAVPLDGRAPTTADLDYHLTTLFPPVRLRGFLEIRYLDATPEPWWGALAAVTATLLDDPRAADAAAAASAPAAGAWERAARLGLADDVIWTAARGCLAAAVDRAPAALRPDVEALAELVERRRSPGDAVEEVAGRDGPAAALLWAVQAPSSTGSQIQERPR